MLDTFFESLSGVEATAQPKTLVSPDPVAYFQWVSGVEIAALWPTVGSGPGFLTGGAVWPLVHLLSLWGRELGYLCS